MISPLTNLSKTNSEDVSTNTSDIVALTTALGTKADSSTVTALDAVVQGKAGSAELTSTNTIFGNHATALNALGGRMTSAETDITTVQGNINTHTGLINAATNPFYIINGNKMVKTGSGITSMHT